MSGINEWPAGEVYTLLALWGQEDMNQARAYEHNEAFQRLLASRLYFHGYRRTFVEVSLQIQALVEKFQKDNKAKSEGKDVPYWEYDKVVQFRT